MPEMLVCPGDASVYMNNALYRWGPICTVVQMADVYNYKECWHPKSKYQRGK
jgi:putative heme iron utilization protein